MYKIIGADGQIYGPVSAEQLKRWLAENRVNGLTLTQPEGGTEWKPMGTLPDFAAEIKSAPPPPLSDAARQNLASRAATKIPAGICGILLGCLGVHKFILGYTGAGLVMLLVTILTCGIGGFVMWIIGLIEGITYLTKSDEEFMRTYVDNRREWF